VVYRHPLLGKDLKTNKYSCYYAIAISEQWLRKHVPKETNTYSNRRTVFLMWSTSRSYKEDKWVNPVQLSSAREAEKMVL
jgi:hypothetical protein